jgi:hypothetical protein
MKYLKIKKLLMPLALICFIFSSCDKVETPEPIGTGGQKIFKIMDYGGLSNFSNTALVYDPSSTSEILELHVEYSTPVVADQDITVTIGVNADAITAYNQGKPANEQYTLLPTTAYTITTATAKIKAKQTVSEPFYIEFNPSMIDQTKNLMLPITVTSSTGAAADVKIAEGAGIAYFHFIGNPLAGPYNVTGTRYNYTTTVAWSGPPAAIPAGGTPSAVPPVKVAIPISSQTVQLDIAAIGAGVLDYLYEVTGDATFANITVGYNDVFNAANSNIRTYLVSYTPPSPTQKPAFHFITHYNNNTTGTGMDRIIDETFVHQ